MRILSLIASLLAGLAALWPGEHAAAERTPLVVIAHPAFSVASIHVSELRSLYLRQSAHFAGERVIPLNYPAGTPLRVEFDEHVLGMGHDEVGRYWVDARIRGFGLPPRTMPVPQLVARSVAVLRGAIGYVPKNMVPGNSVRVLRVDGLSQPL